MESASHASASAAPATASGACATCSQTASSLKRCGRCKSEQYCNAQCQKAHWKEHKDECRRLSSQGPNRSDAKPFTALYHNRFLHDRSQEETFKILIDTIRMRQEDEYALEGNTMVGTIYDGEESSEKAFRLFIHKAKQITGFLPPWWDDHKVEACVRFARRNAQFSLACAQEKADIQESWGDNMMPMKVRMLAEKVYGNVPGGSRGDAMLQMMMRGEQGGDGKVYSMLHMGM